MIPIDLSTAKSIVGEYIQPFDIEQDANYHLTHQKTMARLERLDPYCALCDALKMRHALDVLIRSALSKGESNGV